MSSHHIVREKQEPALLILGLQHFEEDLLGQLLEWSPTVIVTSDIAEKVDSLGIKIDLVIDKAEHIVDLQLSTKYLYTKGYDVTETVLKFLITNNYGAVNIVTDKFLLKDYLFYADKINIVIFWDKQKIYPVVPGFSKWKISGELVTVLSQVPIKTNGLKEVAEHQYKTNHDGFFTISFEQPFIFIAENL